MRMNGADPNLGFGSGSCSCGTALLLFSVCGLISRSQSVLGRIGLELGALGEVGGVDFETSDSRHVAVAVDPNG